MYENAIQSLQDIADGKITLDTVPGTNPWQTANVQNRLYSEAQIEPFSGSKMDDWI